MATPYFSLVIPYHNSGETIGRLLTSVAASKGAPALEVIVVDDGSIEPYKTWKPKGKREAPFPVRVVRLPKCKGPAVARNRGVAVAKGKFVVFLDSDVALFSDALANLASIYRKDPDVVAVTGVWAKEQRTDRFFPNFKALRDWSYWLNERDANGYYYLFSTRIASIKRSVFTRIGGFDETYAGPLVEDIELTYRIARRYAIIFAPNVRVHHEFEDFWPIAKKYFWRTYYWIRLYQLRKKFDPVATTWWEALTALTGAGTAAAGSVSLLVVSLFVLNPNLRETVLRTDLTLFDLVGFCLQMTVIVAGIHAFMVRKFLLFAAGEKGIPFAVRGFFTGIALYCFIVAGALWARLQPRQITAREG